MEVILTYTRTKDFTKDLIDKLSKISFNKIPEMRSVDNLSLIDGVNKVVSRKIPYQCKLSSSDFDNIYNLLSKYGEVDIIGKWNNNGSKIELDINKYREALNNIKLFEDAVFINNKDFTGRENEFIKEPKLDEKGNLVLDENGDKVFEKPLIKTFKREKSSIRPTLKQASNTQVNSFSKNLIREL